MSKLDVLALYYRSFPSRDTEATIPVSNYLKLQGLRVKHGSIHDGFGLILRYRPKCVLIGDPVGAGVIPFVARFAKSMGCQVVSLLGEGFYGGRLVAKAFWGWNHEHVICCDKVLQWSEFSRMRLLKVIPEYAANTPVCGSVGIDRFHWAEKTTLPLSEQIQKYKMVVGVGCWYFSIILREEAPSTFVDDFGEIRTFFEKDRDLFANILYKLVKNNPDVLFILKEHPGNTMSPYYSGIEQCLDFSNVFHTQHAPVSECINTSDIWLSYESTTAVESWVAGKQTALLNPSGPIFPIRRAPVWCGQPVFSDYQSLQKSFDYYKKNKEIPGFTELEPVREKLIKMYVQWNDGLNHVRAGNAVLDLLGTCYSIPVLWRKRDFLKKTVNTFLQWRLSPFYKIIPKWGRWLSYLGKYYKQYREGWNLELLHAFAETRRKQQLDYYTKLGLSLGSLRKLDYIAADSSKTDSEEMSKMIELNECGYKQQDK